MQKGWRIPTTRVRKYAGHRSKQVVILTIFFFAIFDDTVLITITIDKDKNHVLLIKPMFVLIGTHVTHEL